MCSKKRKLRHALDIVRKADDSVKTAMDGVAEEEEFALDLDDLSDVTLLALHEYCEKQILGKDKEEKDKSNKLKVTLSLPSATEGDVQKPKRSHHKKAQPGAVAAGNGPSPKAGAGARGPAVSVKSGAGAAASGGGGAQVAPVKRQRTGAEVATASALQQETYVEPLFGDEEEPIVGLDDLFGGPSDGLANVPTDEGMFGGSSNAGEAAAVVTDGAGAKVGHFPALACSFPRVFAPTFARCCTLLCTLLLTCVHSFAGGGRGSAGGGQPRQG